MGDLIALEKQQMPAHLRKRYQSSHDDLTGGATGGFPVLSYKGKVWHISEGGERTLIQTEDGEPKTSIELVIVKANPFLSKNYYAKAYEEGDDGKPVCYSADGQHPAADAAEPQAAKCAVCPKNQWGSRISDNGSKGKACADSRRMVVVPAYDTAQAPMLLRVPAASLKSLTAYANVLKKRDAPYQAVITRVGFDHNVAHPQFTFKAVGWCDDEQADRVDELLDDPIIDQILGGAQGTHAEPFENVEAEKDEMDELPAERPPARARGARAAGTSKQQVQTPETTVDEVDEAVNLARSRKARVAEVEKVDEPSPKKARRGEDADEADPPPRKAKAVVISGDDDGGLEDQLTSLLNDLDDDD